jgi:hypothetical protein
VTCPPAQAARRIKNLEIPVRIVKRRSVATLVLNSNEVPMLVYSGIFFSYLSANTAAQFSLLLRDLPWGMKIESYTGRVAAKLTVVAKLGASAP